MIKPKLKLCTVCGVPSRLWTSNPATCYPCAKGSYSKPSQATKKRKTISTSGWKDKAEERLKMRQFFESQLERIPERCENCNEPFGFIMPQQRHFIMAHILPKREKAFPSVKFYPDNLMFLCTTCHHKYDDNSTQEERRMMPCYKVAIERLEKFYHLLTPHEEVLLTKYL